MFLFFVVVFVVVVFCFVLFCFVFWCAFSNLCLQVGNLLGFEVVSSVLCLSFGVSCLLG